MTPLRDREALRAVLIEALLGHTIQAPCVGDSREAAARRRCVVGGFVTYEMQVFGYGVARLTSAGRAALTRIDRDRAVLIASVVRETFAAAFREIEVVLMRRGELVVPLSPQIHARYAVRHNIPSLRGPL